VPTGIGMMQRKQLWDQQKVQSSYHE
jgi:hypothetical protein